MTMCFRMLVGGPLVYLGLFTVKVFLYPERALILRTPVQRSTLTKIQAKELLQQYNN